MSIFRMLLVAGVHALSSGRLSAQAMKVKCKDGTKSAGGQGACSSHGGIAEALSVTCKDGTKSAGGQGASLALEDAMMVGRRLADGRRFDEVYADVERLLRTRAERLVKQAADNDVRQVKQLGTLGQWMRDRLFPLFVPLIGRELERQYAALERELQAA